MVLISIIFALQFKHSSFWPSSGVKPMSKWCRTFNAFAAHIWSLYVYTLWFKHIVPIAILSVSSKLYFWKVKLLLCSVVQVFLLKVCQSGMWQKIPEAIFVMSGGMLLWPLGSLLSTDIVPKQFPKVLDWKPIFLFPL